MSAFYAQGGLARYGERFFYFFVETRVGHRVSKGDFARCDGRLRALP